MSLTNQQAAQLTSGGAQIYEELIRLSDAIPEDSPIVGDLQDGTLRMPVQSEDGRKKTWYKTSYQIAKQITVIVDRSLTKFDCWMIPCNSDNGYNVVKLSKDGSRNKWQTHILLHTLLNPDTLETAQQHRGDEVPNQPLVLAHRCGRGKARTVGQPVCVNPYHTEWKSQIWNISQHRCRNGCRFLCPHKKEGKACIFTWPDTGLSKRCFNSKKPPPENCPHDPICEHEVWSPIYDSFVYSLISKDNKLSFYPYSECKSSMDSFPWN